MNKPFATVLDTGTSLCNKTGTWRTMRPEYVRRLPPCNATCPAGENIQLWLSLVEERKFREAWETMVKDNPFPAVMGRVCYHSCEKTCNRTQFDGAVNINLIEKSIGDMAIANDWSFETPMETRRKKILIIGSGPSGLTAAYFLRKLGYEVTIQETHIKPGGMMRYGVPRYRLSNSIIDAEIKRITDLGVKIICNKKVQCLKDELPRFDAIYIATGAHRAAKATMEVKAGSSILDAIDLFRKLEDSPSNLPNLGRKVVVYGGGNSAIDAARTALRLGAENVQMLYRRTIHNMSAHESEVQSALAEGVIISCLRTINTVDGDKILVDRMDYDDESGILSTTGETEVIYADSVICAIGQSIDEGIFSGLDGIKISEKGVIEVDERMMTGVSGVFAGGDVIMGKRTVTHAIGHGKKAAGCIDAHLRGVKIQPNSKGTIANFKKLNTDYYKKSPRGPNPRDKLFGDHTKETSFEEAEVSYSEEEFVTEAARCFSCGNCFHCDNCYGYCPDNAIRKHPDGSLEIDYDYCKGCGVCVAECPCGSMQMLSDEK
ncbi:MAG: FAD-dependent oxidoreductase [Holosporaceae bacterium]|jgi:2-oxoacid:acceptor oxidoreductase delta subunit (pyruvate/2-ketoisovalerate family)|nr:FAD-dependent oxidoreductase [Holosporaceae bacterium]